MSAERLDRVTSARRAEVPRSRDDEHRHANPLEKGFRGKKRRIDRDDRRDRRLVACGDKRRIAGAASAEHRKRKPRRIRTLRDRPHRHAKPLRDELLVVAARRILRLGGKQQVRKQACEASSEERLGKRHLVAAGRAVREDDGAPRFRGAPPSRREQHRSRTHLDRLASSRGSRDRGSSCCGFAHADTTVGTASLFTRSASFVSEASAFFSSSSDRPSSETARSSPSRRAQARAQP